MSWDGITERTYPIQTSWLFKPIASLILPFVWVFSLPFHDHKFPVVVFFMFPGVLLVFFAIQITTAYLRRITFHFSLNEKYITVRQGIIKKQEKHVPYGVIQHVIIQQDVLDRFLGLATFALENATRGAGNEDGTQMIFGFKIKGNRRQQVETIGFMGNRLRIPGLSVANAHGLKDALLKMMKENPLEDNQSGL